MSGSVTELPCSLKLLSEKETSEDKDMSKHGPSDTTERVCFFLNITGHKDYKESVYCFFSYSYKLSQATCQKGLTIDTHLFAKQSNTMNHARSSYKGLTAFA